ncbi:MAG: hypothetical protein FE039_00415 [Thermoplasmata archaeon]|nr:MAG: hypothetical protein FE039_00415 [Thermoplasmata archaeon]
MKPQLIITRYGEIGLKAKTTRKHFENILIKNIKNAFKKEKIPNTIKTQKGRIYVYTGEINIAVKVLQKIFGITSVSPAIEVKSDMDSMIQTAVEFSKEKITSKNSFALRVTRDGKQGYTSQDVAIIVGDAVVKATNASVNLTKPDFILYIEIRNDKAFMFIEKTPGTGGLPLGTQGKTLMLINSLSSILAAWFLMRRGCKIVPTVTDDSLKKIVESFLNYWYAESPIYIVKNKNSYYQLYKIASEQQCETVTVDYSIDDLSMESLSTIRNLKKHVKLPVLTPLIAIEKDEILKKTKEIGLTV